MSSVTEDEMRREDGPSVEEESALRVGMREEMKGRIKPVMLLEIEEESK